MSSSDDLLDQFQASLARSLDPTGFYIQIGIMFSVSVGTVLAFDLLRPKHKLVYQPKTKYFIGKPPPTMSNSSFGWVAPLIHTKEAELVDKVGLDAATFLRFLRMMRWLFTFVGLFCLGVLGPTDYIYNRQHPRTGKKAKDVNILTRLSIRNVDGYALYVHTAAGYGVTIIALVIIYMHWRSVVRLRANWFRSEEYQKSFYARTLIVTQVPKKLQSDEGIRSVFTSVQVPYPTTSVHIGRHVGQLPELIEAHNDCVRKLEEYLVLYLKNGKIGNKRPTIRIGGFLGMGGKKVDAIDHYTGRKLMAEKRVEDFRSRIDQRRAENYGFASMAAVPFAHIVARMLEGKKTKGTQVMLAPNPKDIIWSNLTMGSGARANKRMWGFLILAFVAFLNTIPLAVVSFLANLSQFAESVKFLKDWQDSGPNVAWTFDVVNAILAPAVSALFGWVLPRIMRSLSKYQGATTQSRLDRAVLARYFAFLVISQLIIFTVIVIIIRIILAIKQGVTAGQSFSDIINQIRGIGIVSSIDQAYIDQSLYWLTFFPLRGFLAVFDLAQILNLAWITIKTHLFGRTPRDRREWTQPPEFEYSVYYSNMLFMACVGLMFAPLAPLVAIAAAVVFWVSSFVYKYQLMFVFVTKVETGGRIWNPVVNRVLFSVMLMQALLVLTNGLKFGWTSYKWVASVPPLLLVLGFKYFIQRKFHNSFKYYVPTQQELQDAKVHSERSDNSARGLAARFGHPSLHSDMFTVMLHEDQMRLLPQVYSGKIEEKRVKATEFGGKKVDAAIFEGGLKITGVAANELEMDADLYQRDRGDPDWDARSVMTSAMGSDAASIAPSKAHFYDGERSGSPAPSIAKAQYDRYLADGPAGGSRAGVGAHGMKDEYELAQFDNRAASEIDLPLLHHQQPPGVSSSRMNLQYPSQSAMEPTAGAYREAPLHRPYVPSREPSSYSAYGGNAGYPPVPPGQLVTPPTGYQATPPMGGYSPYASPGSEYPPQRPGYGRDPSGYSSGGDDSGNMAGRGTYK